MFTPYMLQFHVKESHIHVLTFFDPKNGCYFSRLWRWFCIPYTVYPCLWRFPSFSHQLAASTTDCWGSWAKGCGLRWDGHPLINGSPFSKWLIPRFCWFLTFGCEDIGDFTVCLLTLVEGWQPFDEQIRHRQCWHSFTIFHVYIPFHTIRHVCETI